ncbi:phage tail protein, partial [Pseudomonas sp. ABAC61]
MEVYIGTIMTFGFPFAPRDWMLCSGQLLPVNQYSALFALVGVTYGGNGQTTFGLPDLRSRMPISQGQGPGLSNRVMGEYNGTENTSVLINNMPTHTHAITSTLAVSTTVKFADASTSNVLAPTAAASFIGGSTAGPTGANIFATGLGSNPITQQGVTTAMSGGVTAANTGTGLPLAIMNPYLV